MTYAAQSIIFGIMLYDYTFVNTQQKSVSRTFFLQGLCRFHAFFFTRETSFVTSSLLSYNKPPSENKSRGNYSLPLRYPFSEG